MNSNRLRYIFPAMTDFREVRPILCWEHIYGWMEGYGLLFDPLVLNLTDNRIAEWENGWDGRIEAGDFLVTSCAQASAMLGATRHPGIYIRPADGIDIIERDRVSEKECLRTPVGDYYYPLGFPERLRYDRYPRAAGMGWEIGENAALAEIAPGCLAVAFELFGWLNAIRNETPEDGPLRQADLLAAILRVALSQPAAPDRPTDAAMQNLRLDFQAYGVMRLMVQWLREKKGLPRSCAAADAAFRRALPPWNAGDAAGTRAALSAAFTALAAARREASGLDLQFMEFPHMGILLEEAGWFEMEWPHFVRQTLEQYGRWAADYGWRFSIEAGAFCWRNLARRYPETVRRIGQLWHEGKLELTNGTASLPFSMISPLLLQYWQFDIGQTVFREVFGQSPSTYQAQEHALTPQTPDWLTAFGYRRALHMAQNRGIAPSEDHDFIHWRSPDGHGLAAMVSRDRSLSSKGCNYYLDIPLVHAQFGDGEQILNYVNFMDLGSIPFRVPMVRAHGYAPVFGRYTLPRDAFDARCPPESDLPARAYTAADYDFAARTFYRDYTNANALSQPERVVAMTHGLRQTQFAAWMLGRESEIHPALIPLFEDACLQEAHDVMICQGQRRGEFYKATTNTSPYERETLTEAVNTRAAIATDRLAGLRQAFGGDRCTQLLNASEATLDFARISDPQRLAGDAPRIAADAVAVGPFAPWSATPPAHRDTDWTPLDPALTRWGDWTLDPVGDQALRLQRAERRIEVAATDSRHADFTIESIHARSLGPLLALEICCRHPVLATQTVLLDLILTEQGRMAEIGVRYAPGRAFDSADRWNDYLALELRTNWDTLWSFNPNVRGRTDDEKLSSPCYLGLEGGGDPVALLNEGAMVYRAGPRRDAIRWFFHVADETVWQRRMALAFDTANAFQLSRAWSQGVIPVRGPIVRSPADWLANGWDGLGAEGFTRDGRMLLANLNATPTRFPLSPKAPPGLTVRGVGGESRNQPAVGGCKPAALVLNPYEPVFAAGW